jgi:hypothetical protein
MTTRAIEAKNLRTWIRQLRDMAMSHEAIAAHVGCSRNYVGDVLRSSDSDREIRQPEGLDVTAMSGLTFDVEDTDGR